MLGIHKCSVCGKRFTAGDKITITGKWPRFWSKAFRWPRLSNNKKYCNSCFNKKFKKR